MKKYILSSLLIATYAVYMVYQHVSGTQDYSASVSPSTSYPITNVVSDATTNTSPSATDNSQPTDTATAPADVPSSSNNPAPAPAPVVTSNTGQYKDGQYIGVSADAYYGNIQVKAIISGGRLTDVQFLDHPQDRGTSVRINNGAMPVLRSEAIQAQSANVNIVSGATDSSGAFRQSLASALSQAQNS